MVHVALLFSLAASGVGKPVTFGFKQVPAREVVTLIFRCQQAHDRPRRWWRHEDRRAGDQRPLGHGARAGREAARPHHVFAGTADVDRLARITRAFPKAAFTGKRVNVQAIDANPQRVVEAISRAAGASLATSGHTSRLTLTARNLPADQLVAIITLLTGGIR